MFEKVSAFIDYFKYLKNPFEALKFKFGFSDSCNLKIKHGDYSIKLVNINSINRLMHLIPNITSERFNDFLKYISDIDRDEKIVIINDLKFLNIFNSDFIKNNNHEYLVHIEEFFSDDEWSMVNFSGRHVIDIGGNAGDTALYFAKKGAKVISFEPVKHLHELAICNVKLNKELMDNITLVNKGVGGKNGTLTFKSNSVQGYVDEDSSNIYEDSYNMEIISMQTLLNDYNFNPDILKMDCEGCEFEIIQNNDLTIFNEIVFEHHSKIAKKDYKNLIDILTKQGFKIDCYDVNASGQSFKDIGIIHAFKV